MGAAKEKGSFYSKYDYKQHELERHASDRSNWLVGTMIGGGTWTGRERLRAQVLRVSKNSARPVWVDLLV